MPYAGPAELWHGLPARAGDVVEMKHLHPHHQQNELARLDQVKRREEPVADLLGPEMVSFFKQSVQKRQTKLSAVAEAWGRLVPDLLTEHCALQSLHRGTLTVIVDSASHLYELKQLLLAGLEQQLLLACKSAGLRKITLKPGRWYETTDAGPCPPRFDNRDGR